MNNKKYSRHNAMEWWNTLGSADKTRICDTHTELVGSVRRWETLTGREIEILYKYIIMEVSESYVIFELNQIMGNNEHLSLKKVDFLPFNNFDTEKEAIEALIENNKTFENFLILKQIFITKY